MSIYGDTGPTKDVQEDIRVLTSDMLSDRMGKGFLRKSIPTEELFLIKIPYCKTLYNPNDPVPTREYLDKKKAEGRSFPQVPGSMYATQEEKERFYADQFSADPVKVSKKETQKFTDTLDGHTRNFHGLLLNRIATTQFGLAGAINQTTKELRIILDDNNLVPDRRQTQTMISILNEVGAMKALLVLCQAFDIPKPVVKKMVLARAKHLAPIDHARGSTDPTDPLMRHLLGKAAVTGTHVEQKANPMGQRDRRDEEDQET